MEVVPPKERADGVEAVPPKERADGVETVPPEKWEGFAPAKPKEKDKQEFVPPTIVTRTKIYC